MEEIGPRHVKDLVSGAMAETFGGDLLFVLGVEAPPILAPLPTALRVVEFIDRDMDYAFHLVGGDALHLEFQDRYEREALLRFFLYDAIQFTRDVRRIHTTVVYTGAVEAAPDALDGGSPQYRVRNVYLRQFDGEGTLRELREKVAAGQALTRRDAVRLALVPLMRLGVLNMDEAAMDAMKLLRGYENGREQAQLAATVIGLSGRFLLRDTVRRLIDMARTTTPFDELLAERYTAAKAEGRAEGRAEGKAEGRAEGKAESVVAVLEARFGALAPSLRARILAERDVTALDRWLRMAPTAVLHDFDRLTESPR